MNIMELFAAAERGEIFANVALKEAQRVFPSLASKFEAVIFGRDGNGCFPADGAALFEAAVLAKVETLTTSPDWAIIGSKRDAWDGGTNPVPMGRIEAYTEMSGVWAGQRETSWLVRHGWTKRGQIPARLAALAAENGQICVVGPSPVFEPPKIELVGPDEADNFSELHGVRFRLSNCALYYADGRIESI